ncbi:molecular chaperone GrpE [Kineothrix alysoides]|uniref:Protein GrpE n=1 Tax=Kineothrix alysoides TaxID=1469948 RepID=A0A4R1R2K7_9FIRM|nr:nucleotide exchange factor GrpE [Kineothrix alysoides]TCL59522.1 molecular chaperone GrpE [Kineothrix alysoides]
MAEQKDINNQDIQDTLNKEETLDKKIIIDGGESEDKEILPEDISLEGQGEMQAEEAEGTLEDEEGEECEENAGKGFFKKKDKKQEVLKQKVDELEDRVRRQMAEFDNFRKRTDKEKTMMFETGARSIIEKILPVVDNFERGLATIPEEEKGSAFAEGMQMIYKQLMTELDSLGVKPIEAIGQEFNPEYHNAVMQVESEEYETGIIAQELLKGYMYRDTVVRHSMVAVVN